MKKLLLLSVMALAACSSGSSSSSSSSSTGGVPDSGPAPVCPGIDASASTCGRPGDQGNSIGVGKYCCSLDECADTVGARLCSVLGSSDTLFCTRSCSIRDGGMDDAGNPCGEGATCQCAGAGCGCTPNSCL
jgi:hypothetical protein